MARYESWFNYTVQHPYPYRWFTPVFGAVGTPAWVCFVLLYFVTNSFNIVAETYSDPTSLPNTAPANWLGRLPDNLGQSAGLRGCQTQGISIGTKLASLGSFEYTLTGVRFAASDSSGWEDGITFGYNYESIETCVLDNMVIALESLNQSPQQMAWADWNPTVTANLHCNLTANSEKNFPTQVGASVDSGVWQIDLTTAYTFVPRDIATQPGNSPSDKGLHHFALPGADAQPSLSWGCSTSSSFWTQLSQRISQTTSDGVDAGNSSITTGAIYLTCNADKTPMTSLDFFGVEYLFYGMTMDTFRMARLEGSGASIQRLDTTSEYPNIWRPADSLGKALYASILSDLGNNDPAESLLVDESSLEHFTANLSSIRANIGSYGVWGVPGPYNRAFDASSDDPPVVKPVKFYRNFTCQVPTLKLAKQIVFNIIVATIIFWSSWISIFKGIVDAMVLRRRALLRNSLADYQTLASKSAEKGEQKDEDSKLLDSESEIELGEIDVGDGESGLSRWSPARNSSFGHSYSK